MKALLSVAAVAALLTAGTVMTASAESAGPGGRIYLAQMDSAGDGLDPGASAEGNARPNRAAGAAPRVMRQAQPIRVKRVRRRR